MMDGTEQSAGDGAMLGWALVVDDHPLFCEALKLTLSSVDPEMPVHTAETLQGGIEQVAKRGAPRIIVLDLNLPDVTGFDGIVRLRQAATPAPVMVVSSLTDPDVVSSALRAGAQGYVPKHAPRATFRAALDAIGSGERFLPAELDEAAAVRNQGDDAISRLATLTPQQSRILDLIRAGMLNKQIAYELSIAETTVKAHVTAIMRKLNVRSRTQAVLVAQEARFPASA